jgi:hypothetical protein
MHKDCRDLNPLSDVLGIMKSSARVSHVERDKINLADDFKEISIMVLCPIRAKTRLTI